MVERRPPKSQPRRPCHMVTSTLNTPSTQCGTGQALMPISQANTTLKSTNTKCGSWLACESGTAVTHAATDAPPSRASPLPQGDLRLPGTPPTFKPASLCNPMICMEKVIGEGFKRDGLEYGKQKKAVVHLNEDGKPITAYTDF